MAHCLGHMGSYLFKKEMDILNKKCTSIIFSVRIKLETLECALSAVFILYTV